VSGYAPWVKIVHARAGWARSAEPLLQSVLPWPTATERRSQDAISRHPSDRAAALPPAAPLRMRAAQAVEIYQSWIHRWRIAERFTPPDWSIVDLWIARKLLSQGMLVERVQDVLRLASPHFPRRHTDRMTTCPHGCNTPLLFPRAQLALAEAGQKGTCEILAPSVRAGWARYDEVASGEGIATRGTAISVPVPPA
jgi:hypothetical protein